MGRESDQKIRADRHARGDHGHVVLTDVNAIRVGGGGQIRAVVEDQERAVLVTHSSETLCRLEDLLIGSFLHPELNQVNAGEQNSVQKVVALRAADQVQPRALEPLTS